LTVIVRKHASIPDEVTAGLPTVAVRVPSHRVARALMETAGVPVAAPSANAFSRPSPTTAQHVLADLEGRVDLVLDAGPAPIGVESSIVDCTVDPPVLRRPGGIPLERLREVVPDLQVDERFGALDSVQVAPGQLLKHYAPRTELVVFDGSPAAVRSRLASEVRTRTAAGHRVGLLAPEEDLLALAPEMAAAAASGRVVSARCGTRSDVESIARELFSCLRRLDGESLDVILAAAPAPEGLGAAVRDRLARASEGRVITVR
jgi:L-threonylcarbamoyladenylate synthase